MKKSEKCFIIVLGIGIVIVIGVIYENTLSVLRPPSAQIVIDVEKVKKEILQAGLVPQEGMHWKELP